MSERAMDQDRLDNLEFRKSVHSTFHRLFVALRNGNEADELIERRLCRFSHAGGSEEQR